MSESISAQVRAIASEIVTRPQQPPQQAEQAPPAAPPVSDPLQAAAPAPAENAAPQAEDAEIETLVGLAEQLGVPPEQLYNLRITPANGQPMSIGELKDAIQNAGQERQAYQQALAERDQQVEQARQAAAQAALFQQQVSAQVVQAQAKLTALNAMAQSIDWAGLERENPGDAALKRQKFADAMQQAQGELQYVWQQQQATQQQYRAQVQQAGEQQLLQSLPEWRDPKVRAVEREAILSTVQQYGFDPRELEGLADPRIVFVLRDLARLRAHYSQAADTVRAAAQAPSPVRSGLRKSAVKSDAVNKLVAQAKQSKNSRDKISAGRAILQQAGIKL